MGRSSEVDVEQTAVDVRYRRLDALREQTAARLAEVRRSGPSGSPQNRSERDAFATLYEDRLAQLEGVEQRLTFGRLDLEDGSTRYIGRIGLTDDQHSPLLTDWRAPAAQAFYRATAARPDDVVRRRHLVTRGRTVTGVEDEVLDLSRVDESDLPTLSGEGALLASLSAGRTGRMGDIVATIQAEQDAIIRAPMTGALVVQGGPGTGKTAVALHRAAYLLYAHRTTLERSGVLLLGPSRTFLRYIDQVLPSLGETGVVTATIADLVPGVVANGGEPEEVARLKGDARMARAIESAVQARQRVPAEPVEVHLDGRRLQVRPADVRQAIAHARRTGKPHNLARVGFVREMLGRLAEQYTAVLDQPLPPDERAEVIEDLRTTREVRIALNLAWMPLTPHKLVEDLWAKPWRLAQAAPWLDEQERAALRREPGAPWTPADVPLLDEAAELLGEDDQAARAQAASESRRRAQELQYARDVLNGSGAGGGLVSAELLAERFAESGPRLSTAERAASDRAWTYGHVVVDEAQELSAMAWRTVLRRVPTRSLTIVGDVAQTAAAAGARSWSAALDPVLRGTWRLAELTVNYRTPAEVADAAASVARAAALPLGELTSARRVPGSLRIRTGELLATAATATRAAVAALPQDGSGRVAVVAPEPRVPALLAALGATELADHLPGRGRNDLDARLVVLPPRSTKGLEYDAVVLVEPTAMAPADLYVAMTRPTRSLDVVTEGELPDGLTRTGAGDEARSDGQG
ncbi:AAA family ATPase [Isoptericola sp. b441]|uniref:AAA family ATPase n=1 Tax=Actinotalea lenta TaxID=3064654 RepID=A0ABT9DB74_9CELL|nr:MULTISPECIES: AAA family ATPase [unclassified Isoptericola]MDO8107408.1 AAA family ATPase [Isoptericola sp. b441]MDO8120930.1 AAA family ATPase [Isoptericola sp. b490]